MEIILGIIIAGLIGTIIILLQKQQGNQANSINLEDLNNLRRELQETSHKDRRETQERLDRIDQNLVKGIKHSSSSLQKQFEQSAELITKVTKKLTQLDDTNKQVLDFSKQMQSLENILRNKNHRGMLGEFFLESLLAEVLVADQYKMQYKFRNGDKVDAAIFYNSKIIPIDSKFPISTYSEMEKEKDKEKLEQLEKVFKKDIQNRIDETSKYIRPDEQTSSFAFMYIPADGIYNKLLSLSSYQRIREYAFNKGVTIVSPTSFFAYLQTVLEGIKALKMEESLKDIIKNIGNLSRHMDGYETYFKKLGNNLGTTVNMYNNAYREFRKIDKDVYKITEGESGGKVDPLLVDKPQMQD